MIQQTTSERILDLAIYNAERLDCLDIAEFLAYEILDLTELMCSDFTTHNQVIKEILKQPSLSEKTKQIIRNVRKG